MKLYEIPEQYRQALESIDVDEDTGEILNADALNQFEMDAKEKIECAALFCRELEAESECLLKESDRLFSRSKSIDKRIARIKALIQEALVPFNGKVKTPRITVYERRSTSAVVDDFNKIPDEFKKTKTEILINLSDLKKAINAGAEIEGAHLVNKTSVVMR